MKILIALLLAALSFAAGARDDIITGVIQKNGHEIELYKTAGTCNRGWRAASIYPIDKRSEHVAGCWIYVGDEVVIDFVDGASGSFKRSQVIPAKALGQML